MGVDYDGEVTTTDMQPVGQPVPQPARAPDTLVTMPPPPQPGNSSAYEPQQWWTTQVDRSVPPDEDPPAADWFDHSYGLERDAPLEEHTGMPVLNFWRSQAPAAAPVAPKPKVQVQAPPPMSREVLYNEEFRQARLNATQAPRELTREELLSRGHVVGERYVNRANMVSSGQIVDSRQVAQMPRMAKPPQSEATLVIKEPPLRWYEAPIGIPWDLGGGSFMTEDVKLLIEPREENKPEPLQLGDHKLSLGHHHMALPDAPPGAGFHIGKPHVHMSKPHVDVGVHVTNQASDGRDWITVSGLMVPHEQSIDGYRMGMGTGLRFSDGRDDYAQQESRIDPRDNRPCTYEQMLNKYAKDGFTDAEVQNYWRDCRVFEGQEL